MCVFEIVTFFYQGWKERTRNLENRFTDMYRITLIFLSWVTWFFIFFCIKIVSCWRNSHIVCARESCCFQLLSWEMLVSAGCTLWGPQIYLFWSNLAPPPYPLPHLLIIIKHCTCDKWQWLRLDNDNHIHLKHNVWDLQRNHSPSNIHLQTLTCFTVVNYTLGK